MKVRILAMTAGFVAGKAISSQYKGMVMLKSPFAIPYILRPLVQAGLSTAERDDHNIGLFFYSMLVNQGVKQTLNALMSVQLPRGQSASLGGVGRLLGLTQRE